MEKKAVVIATGEFPVWDWAKARDDYFDTIGKTKTDHAETVTNLFRLTRFIPDNTPIADDAAFVMKVRNQRAADLNERTGKPLANATINHSSVDLIQRVHTYAATAGEQRVKTIAWKKLKLSERGQTRRREMTAEEEAMIEPHLRVGLGAAFRFAMMTGLRLSNFSELRWDEVEFSITMITVMQKGGKKLPTQSPCSPDR